MLDSVCHAYMLLAEESFTVYVALNPLPDELSYQSKRITLNFVLNLKNESYD